MSGASRSGKTRYFDSVFSDSSISPTHLVRVHTESWHDGAILLTETCVSRRLRTEHDWPESDGTTTIVEAYQRATAVRLAVKAHDAAAKRVFAEEAAEIMAEAEEGAPS